VVRVAPVTRGGLVDSAVPVVAAPAALEVPVDPVAQGDKAGQVVHLPEISRTGKPRSLSLRPGLFRSWAEMSNPLMRRLLIQIEVGQLSPVCFGRLKRKNTPEIQA